MNSFIITPDSITITFNNKPFSTTKSHPKYNQIIEAIKNNDFELAKNLIDTKSTIQNWCSTHPDFFINTQNHTISYKNYPINNKIVPIIFRMINEGFSVTPMINFLQNLYQNPSKKAIDELYSFLEFGKMPITEDGHFIAYKRVNDDYTSIHDNTTKNNIGLTVSMPRHEVDDRSNNTCSYGLHICSFDYLQHYTGARVIIVKVNPADVVSIPTDYNNTKARVCQYLVINELSKEEANLPTHSFPSSIYNEIDDNYEEDDLYDELEDDEYDDLFDSDYDDDDDEYEKNRNLMKHITNTLRCTIPDPSLPEYQKGYRLGQLHSKHNIPPTETSFTSMPSIRLIQYIKGYKQGYNDTI